MKKIFTIIALLSCAFAVSAQRDVDWEVVEFIEPEILASTTQGTEFRIVAVLRNNGPDTVVSGDSLLYQIVIRNSQNQVLAALPDGSFNFRVLDDQLNPGDTMHYISPNIRINAYPNLSTTLKVELNSRVINRGSANTMNEESSFDNNILTEDRVWANPQGWGVGVEDHNMTKMIELSPNPATDKVSVSWLINSSTTEFTNIQVFDISGRKVIERDVDSRSARYSLNTSDLDRGVYTIQVMSGEYTFTERLVISQ